MRLVPNAKTIAQRSLSLWLNRAGVALLFLPELWYWIAGYDVVSPYFRLWAGFGLMLAAEIARYLPQGIDHPRAGRALWALALAVSLSVFAGPPEAQAQPASDAKFSAEAVHFIGRWEGLRLEAYRDIVGVWTICYGETKGVRAGDRHSKAECDAMLAHEVLSYRARLHRFFTPRTKAVRLPVARDVAFTSLAYNVGVGAAGNSTATLRLNSGNIEGACEALTWWNRAGGRVIRGLVRRRAEERALCMEGL